MFVENINTKDHFTNRPDDGIRPVNLLRAMKINGRIRTAPAAHTLSFIAHTRAVSLRRQTA